MKAEHRHELKTNALADTLGRALQGLKSGPSRHAVIFWGLVVLAAAVGVGGYFLYQHNQKTRSELWVQVDDDQQKLDSAATYDEVQAALDALKKTADANPGTPQARVLRFDRARALLRLGTESLYSDREADRAKARGRVEEARTLYADLARELAGQDKDFAVLRQEALMSVARANESLGELDEALAGYKALARDYPTTPLGEAAQKRADYLGDEHNRQQLKELYAKLNGLAGPPTPPAEKPEK
jgi:hypothetical protein